MELSLVPVSGALTGHAIADGRYHLAERIGSGTWPACGDVYRATSASGPGSVAVRVLPGTVPGSAFEAARRIAEVATRLGRPAIASLLDSGTTPEGNAWLASEFVYGQTLAELIAQQGTLPRGQAVGIARTLLEALAAAHAVGVVHGGLRTASVIVGTSPVGVERVAIVDFGMAELRSGERDAVLAGELTDPSAAAYLSPEAARGEPVDAPADIYAVGLLLYEMLCGHRPHRANRAAKQLKARRRGLVPSVPRAAARTALRNAVGAALASDPAVRPTASELAERLDRALTLEGPKRAVTAPPAAFPLFIEPSRVTPLRTVRPQRSTWWLVPLLAALGALSWWYLLPIERFDARMRAERGAAIRPAVIEPARAPDAVSPAPLPATPRPAASETRAATRRANTHSAQAPRAAVDFVATPSELLFTDLPDFRGWDRLLAAVGRLAGRPGDVMSISDLIGRPVSELQTAGWKATTPVYLNYGRRPAGVRAWVATSGSSSQPAQLIVEAEAGIVTVAYLRLYRRAPELEASLTERLGEPLVQESDWANEPDRGVLSFPRRTHHPRTAARVALWRDAGITIHTREFTNVAGLVWRAAIFADTSALETWAAHSGFPVPGR